MAYKQKRPITVTEGGTGAVTLTGILTGNGTSAFTANAVTQYGTVIAGASNAVSSVAPSATSGIPYISQGAAANPVFGTAVVQGGGTGLTATTVGGMLLGTSTTAFTNLTIGANNTVLVSNGTTASWAAVPATAGVTSLTGTANQITVSSATGAVTLSIPATFIAPGSIASTSTITAGTTITASGMATTGIVQNSAAGLFSTYAATNHTVQIGNASGQLTSITNGTTNQVLVAQTGADPIWAAVPATAGVTSIAGTANQITASAATGAVTLSTPSTFIAPGSIEATTTVTATLGNITITSGNLAITAATTSSVGQITQAGGRFIHTYGTNNLFMGATSGNFTLTVGSAVANIGVGPSALNALTTGDNNCAIGNTSGLSLTTGLKNTLVGVGAAYQLVGGSYNVCVGQGAGQNYTGSESSNILINTNGTLAESNVLRIGSATGTGNTQLNKAFIHGIYNISIGATNHVVSVDSSGQLGLATNPQFFTWTTVTGTTQALVVNNGYVLNNAGVVTGTLPATAAVGDRIEIVGLGAGGWAIAQNAGQLIHLGSSTTTTGVGGSLASTNRYDSITLICIVTTTTWTVMGPVGNITVV